MFVSASDGSQHYCYRCSAVLQTQFIFGRSRETCPQCGWVNYLQLKVGAAALIEREQKILLLQRTQQPWQGCWNLPAGYVEVDEDPSQAAEREVFEECGLVVRAGNLSGAYFFDDDPRGNGLLLVYACEWIAGEPELDPDEASALQFFSATDLPQSLTGAGHERAIRQWAASRGGL